MSTHTVSAQVGAAERFAATLVTGFGKCEMEGRPLTDKQQADIISTALLIFDGYQQELDEMDTLDRLLEIVTPHGVR